MLFDHLYKAQKIDCQNNVFFFLRIQLVCFVNFSGLPTDANDDQLFHRKSGSGGHHHWFVCHPISIPGSSLAEMESPFIHVPLLSVRPGKTTMPFLQAHTYVHIPLHQFSIYMS